MMRIAPAFYLSEYTALPERVRSHQTNMTNWLGGVFFN
jgi:hypothetical protein